MIEYHNRHDAPGDFFSCPFNMGMMSTTFCAERHKKAATREYITDHRCPTCRFCPVGAKHAGERDTVSGSRLYSSLFCSRCERTSNRLVSGRLCVSCYNRALEFKKGKNARGCPLRTIRHYFPIMLLLVKKNVVALKKIENVTSTSEAVFTVLLKDNESMQFGWAGSGVMQNAR